MKEFYQSTSKAPASILLELMKKHEKKQKGLVPDDLNPFRTAAGVASNENFHRIKDKYLGNARNESPLEEPSPI